MVVRTPTVLQMEAVECGAACLGMILAHYGRRVPLEELRVACGVTRDGSTAGNMVRAARRFGLEATGYKREIDAVMKMTPPFVAFWRFNHFVVVEGFSKRGVHLNDPESGRRVVDEREFDRSFTGVVVTFRPLEKFASEPAWRASIATFAAHLSGTRTALWFSLVCGLGLVVPGILAPAFVRMFVDDVLIAGDHHARLIVLGGLALSILLQVVLLELQQDVVLRLQTKLAIANTARFVWILLDMPMSFFGQRSAGELAYRVSLNNRVAELLSRRMLTTAIGFVAAAIYLILMFSFDVALACAVVAVTALDLVALAAVARVRGDTSAAALHEEGRLAAQATDGIAAIETLKAGGTEDAFFRRWSGQQALVLNVRQRLAIPSQILGSVPQLSATATSIAILAIGGWRVIDGTLSIGTLFAFQMLAAQFAAPFASIIALGGDLQTIVGNLRRLDDVKRYPREQRAAEAAQTLPAARGGSTLRVEDVTFGYSPVGQPALSGVTFSAPAGRRIALVGATGSGKSTIARLLAGLTLPASGTLSLDGVPYDRIDEESFARAVAFVDQTITLFPGSIRDNITLWDPGIDDASVERAARDAAIHEEILARPGAYDALVSEDGANFSGGQRQRIEIARALSRDPTLIVLDEATSALDGVTEYEVAENLRRRGCTCVLVAHRLSTVRDCDEILVVEHGAIVERGTHEALSALRGRYFNLVSAA
jgi:NHLM bacteriocin system ABC transporter peptidase/ATP-binding protein